MTIGIRRPSITKAEKIFIAPSPILPSRTGLFSGACYWNRGPHNTGAVFTPDKDWAIELAIKSGADSILCVAGGHVSRYFLETDYYTKPMRLRAPEELHIQRNILYIQGERFLTPGTET